ncbi:peptide/nickel transport system ATP-binding protein [Murinocardiopsis flavida]|uniref:Peptide/nickel transport system ATP-binding protein n=1 Tax=Murinocardiopsis flavida TaxID=645275 RepID=A0A2P8DSV6_9ACTN|nr:ABC transporter ATP-binding protein [Murinocardiopsis flavida]PSL00294.1 peptide/nickel transport system ATP-binding protein [Murinocardiopsis flavida]
MTALHDDAPDVAPVLGLDGLSVDFRLGGEWVPAVKGVSFGVRPGEILAVVGESGSGKSVSTMAVLGLLPPNTRRSGGIRLAERDLLRATVAEMLAVRGREVAMIFQEPMTALNPVYTVGEQIVEAIRCHQRVTKAAARKRAVELLTLVNMPEPEVRADSYPHQLSGGQRQRAMIAMAISGDPKVLIADEPTTALDVTVQAEILDLLRDLRHRLGSAIVVITHDMGVVADLADRVVVMREGEVVEEADVHTLFASPRHDYTRRLLDAVPHLGRTRTGAGRRPERAAARDSPADPGGGAADRDTTLVLDDVVLEYPGRLGRRGYRAVHGVSLDIERGEILGLVGESGSGKSTIGRAVVGLLRPVSGSIGVCGLGGRLNRAQRLRLSRTVAMVFQDPASSLNPRASIGDSIAEPFRLHRVLSGAPLTTRVGELLESVELPASWRDRYPHELSGGQRQRVGIARAIALEPELLIADEPTSALDVSVQARVLDLFLDLQQRLGFSALFISHDLAVVETLADRIAVLRDGRLVELGKREQVLHAPKEDYTRDLIAAAPVPDPVEQRRRRTARAGTDEV